MEKSKTLHEKLVEVALEVRNIAKGGRNTAQSYDYVREVDVVNAVVPKLLERGILFYPLERTIHSVETYQTRGGTTGFVATGVARWRYTDGKETLDVEVLFQGADTGDKGVYKGMTGDKKYAMLQSLGIATGDDPEIARPDEETDDGMATPAQLKKLYAMANQTPAFAGPPLQAEKLRKWVYSLTGKNRSDQLTKEDMSSIFDMLDVLRATGGEPE